MDEKCIVLDDAAPIVFDPVDLTVYDIQDAVVTEKELEGGVFHIACCDCGLVHRMEVIRHKISGEIGIRFLRDDERTGERRRETES